MEFPARPPVTRKTAAPVALLAVLLLSACGGAGGIGGVVQPSPAPPAHASWSSAGNMSFDLWDSPNGASFQCSSNDICWVATDGNGGKLIAFDGQYTYGHYLPESEQAAGPDGNYPWLTSSTLACPGDDYCITADNRGYTMVFAGDASSNQHLGTPRQVDPSGSPVTVGCTSKESCFAVARNAQQYFRLQLGNTWSPAPLPGFATAESGYPRISCTPGLCVLLYAHRVSTYNGKRWSPTVTLPALAKGEAYAIGCSHTFCLASSSSATWIYEAGHWSRDRQPRSAGRQGHGWLLSDFELVPCRVAQ